MNPSRNWCFTCWNLEKKPELKDKLRYCVWQKEKCPKTEKIHLQGYAEFTTPVRMSHVKKWLDDNTLHLETRKGSALDAINYCKKEESRIEGPWEIGKLISQGNRSDLDEVCNKILENQPLEDIACEHPTTWSRYHRGLRDVKVMHLKKISKKLRDITCIDMECIDDALKTFGFDCYIVEDEWFDGYNGEKTIIVNKLNADWKCLLQKGPTRLKTKGGFTYANWEQIVFVTM